jgi:hypothetical protein
MARRHATVQEVLSRRIYLKALKTVQICAVHRPLVTSQTTAPISMTEAKGDGSGWEESRDSSAKPVG